MGQIKPPHAPARDVALSALLWWCKSVVSMVSVGQHSYCDLTVVFDFQHGVP
jgi:hypothetical protein